MASVTYGKCIMANVIKANVIKAKVFMANETEPIDYDNRFKDQFLNSQLFNSSNFFVHLHSFDIY